MKQTLKKIFASIVACLATTSAYAGIFTYAINPMDAERGIAGCQVDIADAATKFSQAAGVTVVSHGCEVDSALGRLTGKILYSAAERVMPWSTTSTTYGEEINLYTSREQCELGLAAEVEYFQHASSLTPFIAYCYKTSPLSAPRYRTRVEAIGETSIRRYESSTALSYPLQDLQAVVGALNAQASTHGLLPVAWYQGAIRSIPSLAVAYYAERSDAPLRLLGKRSLYYSTLGDCESAVALANQTNTAGWQGVLACSVAPESIGFQLNFLWWDRSIGADMVLESTAVPGAHASLGDCHAAASALAAQLAQSGERVVGFICGRDQSRQSAIRMEIISTDQ